jgi:O-6-methylguanine DNA methyltransferase
VGPDASPEESEVTGKMAIRKSGPPCFYRVFETALGFCGIAWERTEPAASPVVMSFQLPEATKQLTEEGIARRSGGRRAVPPQEITELIKKIQKHLSGEPQDFRDVRVDLAGAGLFARQVYQACAAIPTGRTITYGELAKAIDRPGAGRAIGQALGRNPIPLIIPCHRVLAAGNRPGGFSAPGGLATKARMLEIEGAAIGLPATIKSLRDLKRVAAVLRKKDPQLAGCLAKPIEFRLRLHHSPYETLIEAVVHQQLSPKAATAILGRVKDLYPGSNIPDPAALLATPDAHFRSAGLSRAKTRALKDIAQKSLDNVVPSSQEIVSLGNEEIIKRLTSIYGVGRWTVEMMLIFNLGRMDVYPVDDYGLRKAIARVYKLKEVPGPKQMRTIGDAWRPYRTAASLYLWNCVMP